MIEPRKKNRLPNYDYSFPGYYYITICTQNKIHHFGNIKNEEMLLSKIGSISKSFWESIPKHFSEIELDEYIIMPNHIYGILIINDAGSADLFSLQDKNDRTKMLLSKCINQFKGSVTRFINQKVIINNFKWQKSFYERIIRNERELFYIRRYIKQNPLKWNIEKENI
ncbi:MAG: transposase, partial [Ignavibacteriaceae bacterium]